MIPITRAQAIFTMALGKDGLSPSINSAVAE
jgi:hypothetical protein